MTLDEYYKESEPIKFIKCDVEGHELDVFKGAYEILLRDKPCLLFECHHEEAGKGEIFSFLKKLGYDGFFLHRSDLIHYSKFREYPCRKKTESHRNYIFY